MTSELYVILEKFGTMGLWAFIIDKLFDLINLVIGLSFVWFGVKKAWPHFKSTFTEW